MCTAIKVTLSFLQHLRNLSLREEKRRKLITLQIYMVCLALTRLSLQLMKPQSASPLTSLVKSQNGSTETSWEMDLESSKSETKREYNTSLKQVCQTCCQVIKADYFLLLPPFSSGSTTGLMAWLSCTSSKYPMVRWLTKVASWPVTATRPTRKTTASQFQSLVPSPCQTPAKTSFSVFFQDLNCQVSVLSMLEHQNLQTCPYAVSCISMS